MEYVVNQRGERTKVILSIEEYERLIETKEDAEDLLHHRQVMSEIRSGERELVPFVKGSDFDE